MTLFQRLSTFNPSMQPQVCEHIRATFDGRKPTWVAMYENETLTTVTTRCIWVRDVWEFWTPFAWEALVLVCAALLPYLILPVNTFAVQWSSGSKSWRSILEATAVPSSWWRVPGKEGKYELHRWASHLIVVWGTWGRSWFFPPMAKSLPARDTINMSNVGSGRGKWQNRPQSKNMQKSTTFPSQANPIVCNILMTERRFSSTYFCRTRVWIHDAGPNISLSNGLPLLTRIH